MKRILLTLSFIALTVGLQAYNVDTFHLTVDATAGGVSFPAAKLNANPSIGYIQCTLRTAEISYSFADAGNETVTSGVGTLLETGQQIVFTRGQEQEMRNFRAIRTTSTSGVLDCHIKY